MAQCPISVLEARWWNQGNHSVRELFSTISAHHYDNPSAHFYDMFVDKHSLSTMLNLRAKDGQTEVIYLGTHGDENSIQGAPGQNIPSREFRKQLCAANTKRQIKGLFLGTCSTGNLEVAKYLFAEKTNLDWIAGYRKDVDWIEGSAIDMVFFHKLMEGYVQNSKRRNGKKTPSQMAHEAAGEMLKIVPGAHNHYGFNIYFKQGAKMNAMFA